MVSVAATQSHAGIAGFSYEKRYHRLMELDRLQRDIRIEPFAGATPESVAAR